MLINSKLAALLVVIRLLSFIILFIAPNPRSQTALLGDRASVVNCHKQLVEFNRNVFPTLAFYSIKPRLISWLLVLHKLFTSSSPIEDFHLLNCVDSNQPFD